MRLAYEERLKAMLAGGTTTSSDVLRREVLRNVIYKEADLLSVGVKLSPPRTFNELDVKWSFPAEVNAEYPVAEGAAASRQQLDWTTFDMTLEKAETRVAITDEAKLRQLQNFQVNFSRRRASEAIAREKDKEILSTLKAGANQNVTIAAGNEWDASGADPAGDISQAIGNIMNNSSIVEADFSSIGVAVHTNVWHTLMSLQSIGNIQQSVRDYLEKAYNINFYPSRDDSLVDTALVVVVGDQTSVHGVLDTDQIPLVEEERETGYDLYTVRQFFKTKVVPDSSSVSTSNRICTISNTKA